MYYLLKTSDAEKVLEYLGTRPLNEVLGVVTAFQQGRTFTADQVEFVVDESDESGDEVE